MTAEAKPIAALPVAANATPPARRPADLRVALTAPQKAALIIAALGPEAAGPIVERVTDQHLRAFARAYAHLSTIPRNELLKVIKEFVGNLDTSTDELKGGFDETREILSQFKGEDEILRLMDDIDAPGGRTVWEKLEETGDEALSEYLRKQNPQTIAVVLSKLGSDKASNVLAFFEDELARDVLFRLSRPLNVNPTTLRILSDTIEREFFAATKKAKNKRNPGQMIGAMLNNLPTEKREALLEFMSEKAPDIASDMRRAMLTFPDFAERVPAKAVAIVIREVDESVFLKAVKFGRQNAPSTVEFIFANISKRMAQQYEEQLEKLQKVTVKDAEAAQGQIMSAVRKLEAAGDIVLNEIKVEGEEEEDEEDYL